MIACTFYSGSRHHFYPVLSWFLIHSIYFYFASAPLLLQKLRKIPFLLSDFDSIATSQKVRTTCGQSCALATLRSYFSPCIIDTIKPDYPSLEIIPLSSSGVNGGIRLCNIAWQFGQTGMRSFIGSTR